MFIGRRSDLFARDEQARSRQSGAALCVVPRTRPSVSTSSRRICRTNGKNRSCRGSRDEAEVASGRLPPGHDSSRGGSGRDRSGNSGSATLGGSLSRACIFRARLAVLEYRSLGVGVRRLAKCVNRAGSREHVAPSSRVRTHGVSDAAEDHRSERAEIRLRPDDAASRSPSVSRKIHISPPGRAAAATNCGEACAYRRQPARDWSAGRFQTYRKATAGCEPDIDAYLPGNRRLFGGCSIRYLRQRKRDGAANRLSITPPTQC